MNMCEGNVEVTADVSVTLSVRTVTDQVCAFWLTLEGHLNRLSVTAWLRYACGIAHERRERK